MTIREFLARLDHVRPVKDGWVARCPAHDDRNPSLSVWEGRDGRIMFHCHTDCAKPKILAALGLTWADVMGDAATKKAAAQFKPGAPRQNPCGKRDIPENHARSTAGQIASEWVIVENGVKPWYGIPYKETYLYRDESGVVLFKVRRHDPTDPSQRKQFPQYHPDPEWPDRWKLGRGDTPAVPYRLPEILDGIRRGEPVVIAEGEKDVLALVRAGLNATCNPCGAGKWQPGFAEYFKGAVSAVIFADKDEPGRRHAEAIAANLHPVVKQVKVVEVPDINGRFIKDPHDYIEAGGSDLLAIMDEAPEWKPAKKSEPTGTVRLTHSVEPSSDDDTADDHDIPGVFLLPSDKTQVIDSARVIFKTIAATHTMFTQGGAVVELAKDGSGRPYLKPVRPDEFCSRLEGYGRRLMVWRVGRGGDTVLAERRCPEDAARRLLASKEARELLPPISLVSKCPVLIEDNGGVRVAGPGYTRAAGGILVTGGDVPPDMPVDRARELLHELLADFDFACPGDRARALAAIITPALRMGRLMRGFSPLFVVEADQSQAGKGFFGRLVRAIYRDKGYTVTMKDGGVGGFDESVGQAILSGSPFVELDNIRGCLDSQSLESLLTNDGDVPVRVPHRAEVRVDASKITWSMTSNGAEATRDLANRSCIVRIRKRPRDYAFRSYPEGDVLRHVEANPDLYLGAVLTICRAWVDAGRPQTREHRHDFREWAQALDWIVRELLGAGELMAGHEAAQERVSNPSLTWLRSVALAITQGGREPGGWTASRILDLCEEEGIEVPVGRGVADEKAVGRILSKCFIDADKVEIDDVVVTRRCFSVYNPKVRKDEPRKEYEFARLRAMRAMRDGDIIPGKNVQIFQEFQVHPACPANPQDPPMKTSSGTPSDSDAPPAITPGDSDDPHADLPGFDVFESLPTHNPPP